jgi:hypothetical protein
LGGGGGKIKKDFNRRKTFKVVSENDGKVFYFKRRNGNNKKCKPTLGSFLKKTRLLKNFGCFFHTKYEINVYV